MKTPVKTKTGVSELRASNNGVSPRSRRSRGEALNLATERILHRIQQLGPNARLPGLRTLCEEIGVSVGTLNLALNRLEQQRIIVRRERSGVFVAPLVKNRHVAVICSPRFFLQSNGSPFWHLLLAGFEEAARLRNTRLTITFCHPFLPDLEFSEDNDPSPLPDHLQTGIQAGSIQGVFAIGLPHPTTRWIEKQGVPVVSFAGAARYMVGTSRRSFFQQGLKGLGEIGCRSVELWFPPDSHWQRPYQRIVEWTRQIAQDYGISDCQIVPAEPISADSNYNSPGIETGWRYAYERLSQKTDVGLLICDDLMALGALMALPHLGRELGRDLHIASYANAGSPVLLGWQHQLIRVEYDPGLLIARMNETLDALMDYGPAVPPDVFLPELPFDSSEEDFGEAVPEKWLWIHPRLVLPEQSTVRISL